ncbi:hypothetical protein [Kallotenue papyrolyticum]|uniref:hypothetical protein n=1 Tax=Kallotenue papyrolyticum TaxID=1325125 RepID=UPI0004785E9C|nr:hypothetical protein [Kallotenue papyrolyticum]
MLDRRVRLTTDDIWQSSADALVVEDSAALRATRGLAALLDDTYPALRAARAALLQQHGGSLPIGAAVALALPQEAPYRYAIWAVTSDGGAARAVHAPPTTSQRITPLAVTLATRNAVLEAAAVGARHVVLPALGTRAATHVLPPVPKKLPRYVMGAAQLAGLQQALEQTPGLTRVTLALSQRDYTIFQILLGNAPPGAAEHP